MSKNEKSPNHQEAEGRIHLEVGLGGLLKGVADVVGSLGDLAKKTADVARDSNPSADKNVRGVYGVSFQMHSGDKSRVEPFGNIRQDARTGEAVVGDVFEPMVDIFEEDDHTLIVAEMPGVSTEDIHLNVKQATLTISAERGAKKYRKQIQLSHVAQKERIKISSNNGVVELNCLKPKNEK